MLRRKCNSRYTWNRRSIHKQIISKTKILIGVIFWMKIKDIKTEMVPWPTNDYGFFIEFDQIIWEDTDACSLFCSTCTIAMHSICILIEQLVMLWLRWLCCSLLSLMFFFFLSIFAARKQRHVETFLVTASDTVNIHGSHWRETIQTKTHRLSISVNTCFACMGAANVSSRLYSFGECAQYSFISSRINSVFFRSLNFVISNDVLRVFSLSFAIGNSYTGLVEN